MKVEGSYPFSVSREFVWQSILDPEVLAVALPGVQQLEQVEENEYKAVMKIRIGPVQGVFSGTVKLSELNPPEACHLHVDGKGAPGFVKGEGDLKLESLGESTVLQYSGDAQVGGRLASVGQRLMESSTQALIRQSLESLDAQITARVSGEEAVAPAEPPSQIEFAAGVTRKMIEDMLPAERQEELVRTGVVIIFALFLLRFISDWWTNRLANRVADIIDERLRSRG